MSDIVTIEQNLNDLIIDLDKMDFETDNERRQIIEVINLLNKAANKLTEITDNYIEG